MASARGPAGCSRLDRGPDLPWAAWLDRVALRIHVTPPRGRRLGAPALLAGPALLSAAAVLVHLLPGVAGRLEYDRAAVLRGELWRLLTGHWTHLSADHLALDVVAFAALGAALAWRGRRIFWRTVLGSAAAISLSLLLLGPQWSSYRGLSGIDSALFTALATLLWLGGGRSERPLGAVALALFAAKIACESITGVALFTPTVQGHDVVPLAHLAGAAVGLAVAVHSFGDRLRASRIGTGQPRNG